MSKRAEIVLITGTDTGVGKTTVTCALVQELLGRGVDLRVMKPIETGCEIQDDGALRGLDAGLLEKATAGRQSREEIAPYLYQAPLAPKVAAEELGEEIDLAALKNKISELAASCDLLLVEGAGGLLVPICEGYTFAELASDCEMKVIVVVGSRLGALNHSALTFEVLKRRELPVLGYIYNEPFSKEPVSGSCSEEEAISTNRREIQSIAKQHQLEELSCLPLLEDNSRDVLTQSLSGTITLLSSLVGK